MVIYWYTAHYLGKRHCRNIPKEMKDDYASDLKTGCLGLYIWTPGELLLFGVFSLKQNFSRKLVQTQISMMYNINRAFLAITKQNFDVDDPMEEQEKIARPRSFLRTV